jgi:hypothetical protein
MYFAHVEISRPPGREQGEGIKSCASERHAKDVRQGPMGAEGGRKAPKEPLDRQTETSITGKALIGWCGLSSAN